jgi:preprotein translocase subunit SecA
MTCFIWVCKLVSRHEGRSLIGGDWNRVLMKIIEAERERERERETNRRMENCIKRIFKIYTLH